MTQFTDLALRPEIQAALQKQGYTTPTPIQAQSIGPALEGRDVLGLAQTGTGKTAAFALPLINHLAQYAGQIRRPGLPKALILAPTRELAVQIGDSCKAYQGTLNLRHAIILGGVSQNRQQDMLDRGVDFVIATPGRLLDLLEQRILSLASVEMLILDEADRMLDMGFIHDIKRIMTMLPAKRQTMFFSATMSGEVGVLAGKLLNEPVRVEVAPVSSTAERVEQAVIMTPNSEKRQILIDLLAMPEMQRVIIFTRTKHGADKVAILLERAGITTGALHGRKSQNARQSILRSFASGKIRALVATDIASRGIDVDDVTHVINYELPNEPEIYVHRIGRTARAGKAGMAVSLCAGDETSYLRSIERLTRQRIPVSARPPVAEYKVPAKVEHPRSDADEGQQQRGGQRYGQRSGFGGPRQERGQGGDRGRYNNNRGNDRQAASNNNRYERQQPSEGFRDEFAVQPQDRRDFRSENRSDNRGEARGDNRGEARGERPARGNPFNPHAPKKPGGYNKSRFGGGNGRGPQRSEQGQSQGDYVQRSERSYNGERSYGDRPAGNRPARPAGNHHRPQRAAGGGQRRSGNS